MSKGWPVELRYGALLLRPLRVRDASAWRTERLRNRDWLAPWEATAPSARRAAEGEGYVETVRALRREARAGLSYPFALVMDGEFAGQITVSGITRGSVCSGAAGYWIARRFAGRGIMPTALALVVDHCFGPGGLHRIEANIRPENAASRRVVEKLGFRLEGTRVRYIHIAGAWRDHLCYALTVEDVPEGVLARWLARGGGIRPAASDIASPA
ncbi:GCN5-related N-acetyltransferase [Acidothermus cellulolyticus 11B]|uniref:GCN5-related N-acetyltransferase n=1 Tax=Acidothermus cellulolyticus (strain ATCC 43068 / DSM 8971 / 11B) TaxID=351607 RepID=A0LR85_ACIC1|nr:GNAT family protein [Acidothermus cellulolyticus]ABK51945.1 GCN5-related N-acetyltransferase [Acidothermus cellulolyticus 11B]